MSAISRRLGAYILAADPTWLRSSLARYYDHLDRLVIAASASNRGWTGKGIRAAECTDLALGVDHRGIAQVVTGEWCDGRPPLTLETAQRQAAIDALSPHVDWILQVDPDEVLPDPDALLRVLDEADRLGLHAVEWPMRVLYRRLAKGRYLQVVDENGNAHVEYPGAIAVRSGTKLIQARRAEETFLRPYATGQESSLQLQGSPAAGEVRLPILNPDVAIVHNSWARSPRDVRAKIASWGHNEGLRSKRYYYATWLPTPLRWRRMQDFHPFASGLWPRLAACNDDVEGLLVTTDR